MDCFFHSLVDTLAEENPAELKVNLLTRRLLSVDVHTPTLPLHLWTITTTSSVSTHKYVRFAVSLATYEGPL